MNIDDATLKAIAASLNMRQMRQEIITSNVANADTPGYKAKRIDFEEALAQALDIEKHRAMKISDKQHHNVGGGGFESLEPNLYEDPNGVVSADGNTVDRDQEMALMAKNRILYEAAVQLLNKKLGLIKYTLQNER